MKKIPRKNLIFLAVILTLFTFFVIPKLVFQPLVAKFHWEQGKKTYYCPMHPTYSSDRPGDCPICNMKLVPKEKSSSGEKGKILYYRHPMGQPDKSPVPKKDSMGMDYIPVYEDEAAGTVSTVPGYAGVHIPVEKQQMIGLKTGNVEKKKIVKEIRTVGRVAYDPDLYVAQQDFISSVKSLEETEAKGPYHEPIERTRALVDASRMRLKLLGMSEVEINDLEKIATRDSALILADRPESLMSNPKRFVWVYATIYEYEIPFVQIGNLIKVRVPAYPDKEFKGEVRAIDPVLQQMTRSIRLRARVENPEGLLRPEMYVDVYLQSELGESLTVPEEAVMLTGERAIVFVAKGEGFFEPRDVKIGVKGADYYEIKSGLEEGDKVVTSANFLIDSESRLKGALQGMGEGHSHGQ